MPGLILGIGTIKTPQDATAFIEAGADFLISPCFDASVADVAYMHKVLWIPGCMTPTEIIAAENAKFGQPEIKLGVIPGAGGTQRLPRAVGKAKAMDMALTGRMMDANEAERAGLVSRIVPLEKLMEESLAAALMIAGYSQIAVMAAKESINRAYEGTLSDGVMFERRMFHALFATQDQKEGMAAFVEKRKANFSHQ